jgi:predicted acetyltransferase
MNVTIHSIEGQEMLDARYNLGQYAFHSSPPFQDKEEWLAMVRERKGVNCFAADEGQGPVAVASSTPMTQNMREALYPAAGIWGVATHPSARRKGYVRQVMGALLESDREHGKVFSNLYPFRESFYERLGYVSFPLTKIAHFAPSALAPLLKLDLGGDVELKLISEAYTAYREYMTEIRQQRHGMAVFDSGDQAAANRNRSWVALAKFNGSIEGMMLYALEGEEATRFKMVAPRFYYQTVRARALLLNWIARHVDQADRVDLYLPAEEVPESWLVDLQVRIESADRSAMSRILDVSKVGGMRVGEGGFNAAIIDPLCPWNQGAWHFEGCDGRLEVSRAHSAECELTIHGLTALVSGTHDPREFALRGWGSPDESLQAIQRKMFPRMVPYMHEVF